jgi:hypothetical protein
MESLINYPLGPTQFEVEWKKLVDECGIGEHPSIVAEKEKNGLQHISRACTVGE